MAYEVTSGNLGTALTNSGSLALNQSVIDRILSVVGVSSQVTIDSFVTSSDTTFTVPAGTEVGFFHTSDTDTNSITIDNPPPIIVLQSSAGVEVLVNTGTDASGNSIYVIVGSAGNDHITVVGTHNTEISLGTGDNTVVGGSGNDTVVYNGGNDTIDGGGGDDSLIVGGHNTTDYNVNVVTVLAGTSDLAQAAGTDHVILTNTSTGDTIDLTGVQYVQFDNDALIVANSTVEAGVASLYHAAFGRTGEAGGVGFWFDHAQEGLSLHDIAVGFTQSAEFAPDAALSNADFITQLYLNTFNRAPDTGGMAYWTQQLANGATRADLLTSFATVGALNESGAIHTEVTVVGTVIIVDHIV
jgi:hypothetical protein